MTVMTGPMSDVVASQHGVFSTAQAADVGLTPDQVGAAISVGDDVWMIADEADEHSTAWTMLLESVPAGPFLADGQPAVVISGYWAASLHGAVWPVTEHNLTATAAGAALVNTGHRFTNLTVANTLPDWVLAGGLPVLSVIETWRWAAVEAFDPVNTGRWIDDLIRDGRATLDELEAATPTSAPQGASECLAAFTDDVGRW